MSLSILSRFIFITLLVFSLLSIANAQDKPRKSPKASVTQRIGADTDITINYSRPGVKDRIIWGELVPYGMSEGNDYSKGKPYPWRAGANENTTIEFSNDVMIEGEKIAAGKYGLHMIPSKDEDWVVIFNKNNSAWGSYAYDEAQDALRVNVIPEKAEHQEWLEYGFDDLSDSAATAFLHWEHLKIPFSITVAGN